MNSFTLELTDMAHGGAALGRHEGKVIFVPYALPGETARVEITDDHDRYAHARVLEVLEPSPDRVPPPCPYFGPQGCGGCQWQHAAYEAQVRYKAEVLVDQLGRIGRFDDPPVEPTLPDATGWAYRNRARFHPAEGEGLGFLAADRHEVVPVEFCLIIHDLLSEIYESLDLNLPDLEALILRAGISTGDQMLIFEMAEDEPPSVVLDIPASCVILLSDGIHANLVGKNYIIESVAGRDYRVSAPSFFQANTRQAGKLVELVLDFLDLQGGEVVLDGYAGVGLFTLPIAERAGLVVAVEQHPPSVEDLLENAAEVENVEIVEGPVDAVVTDLSGPYDAAVVDPPRTGLDRETVEALVAADPRRLVYVSCDPATLARDSRQLAQAGYHLETVQPIDMFPQTYHVESVSRWVKGG